MTRAILSALLALVLGIGISVADDKRSADKSAQATITKVDAKNHTLTVKMKDKNGKTTQKSFKLTEEVRYFDSTGKAVAIDVFKNGDDILVVEAEGKLKEVRKSNKGGAQKP